MNIQSVYEQPDPYAVFTNETELLKAKKIHIVCEAAEGEDSMALKYMTEILPIKRETAVSYIKKVNSEKEAASLHPVYTFSMFPHISLAKQDKSTGDLFEEYLYDLIFEANERFIKAETMLFAFEKNNTPEIDWFKNIIDRMIYNAKEKAGLLPDSLRTIYYS